MKYLNIFLICVSVACLADTPSFQEWLNDIEAKARAKGFKESTLIVLKDLQRDQRVLQFDRRQPEFVQTFEEYLSIRLTQDRIDTARQHYARNSKKLDEIAAAYQVDAQYLVAFWGLESSFGRYQGKYSIIRSLATLGYDARRSEFFTRELFIALQILDEGHISATNFVGGWAGAMGQNQFLPSSFIAYAQDYDGDGKKNIWHSQDDVWASIAYYLKKHHWKRGDRWGQRIKLSRTIDFDRLRPSKVNPGCRAYRHHTRPLSLSEWRKLGVEIEESGDKNSAYAMVIPESGESSAYLVGPNFKQILAYNCANKYAVSVGLLADAIVR